VDVGLSPIGMVLVAVFIVILVFTAKSCFSWIGSKVVKFFDPRPKNNK